MWLKRRLRRLVVTEGKTSKRPVRRKQGLAEGRGKAYQPALCCMFLVLCVGLGLTVWRWSPEDSSFWEMYNNQYHSIVHNRTNYCDRSHRLGNMVTHCRRQVLHQEEALDELERALDNVSFQNIALVGSSGVGKSLTAQVLREQFPWPENVKTVSWRDSSSLLQVKSMLNKVVQCGQNLILIDNMTPQDAGFVAAVNELIRGRDDIANSTGQPHLKRLTVVFIFCVNRLQPDEKFDAEMEALKQLSRTQVITYASFEASHLLDCIRREALLENMQLDNTQIDEIIRGSDPRISGCKTVRAKVLMYGQPTAPRINEE
ncbi:hypothetical protein KR054_000286 [Drosophila jambulina]|nr:hypothetical protein KR054_000286 [Drosophila jambulina]